MRSSGTISPLEAAVVAQRPEWVKTCLDSWGLCGDLIMVDGRHVLSFALENSGIDTVRLLMQKGQLKPRFVLDSGEGFNLDGVMVQGVYQAWRDLYRVRNLAAVPSLLAEEYKEFQGETCHQRVDLYQAKRAKIELCEAEQVDDSKEKARLEILVQALGLYLSTVRSAPTQDCGSEIYKKWKSPALLPLCDAGSILGCAIGVPELADLSMMIM